MRFASFTAICSVLLSEACSAPRAVATGVAPSYYTVHVDYVLPVRLAQFEQARAEWMAILARYKASDERGAFLQLDDKAFITLRGFESFAELDQRRASRAKALAAVPKEASERYDQLTDATLTPPHRNEVWMHLDDLDYRAPGPLLTPTTASFARVVLEEVPPTPGAEDKYSEAWIRLRGALEKERYPLTRATFFSLFGSGRYVTFWLAPTAEALAGAPSIEETAAKVLGKAEAEALLAQIQASVVDTEVHAVRLRPELSSRESIP